MSELYVGKDGILLEWREHILTEALKGSDRKLSPLEPVLRSKAELRERQLEVLSTDRLSWTWGSWRRVRAELKSVDGNWTTQENALPPIEWFGKTVYETIELTPFDSRGPGATVRIERPQGAGGRIVEIREGVKRGDILVRSRILSAQISVWVIRKASDSFKHRAIVVSKKEQVVELGPREGRCAIAVVCERAGRRELLACRQHWDGRLQDGAEPAKLHDDIRPYVEGSRATSNSNAQARFGEWLRAWPRKARERLQDLQQAALALDCSQSYVEQAMLTSLTGLYRLLALRLNEVEVAGPRDQNITQLDSGNFAQAICAMHPRLFDALNALEDGHEKRWACRKHNHRNLVEASDLAKGRGEKALEQALDLISDRARARDLMKNLYPSSPLHARGAELVGTINDFFIRNRNLAALRKSLEEFEAQVKADAGRKAKPGGTAPSDKKRRKDWEGDRQRQRQWRCKLAQVITLCESGDWREIDEPFDSAEPLMAALKMIVPPAVQPRSSREVKLEDDLKAAIEWINDKSDYEEDDPKLRQQGCKALRDKILPHAAVWAPLRQDIHQARELAGPYPELAAASGINVSTGDLNRQAKSAHFLMDLVDAMQRFAAESRIRALGDKQQLLEIISRPNHDAIREAFREAMKLKEYFQSSNYVDPPIRIRESAPLSPESKTLAGFEAWWREVAALFNELDRSRRAQEDYAKLAGDICSRSKEGMRRYLDSSDHHPGFKELFDRCFASEEIPRPKDLNDLMKQWNEIQKGRDRPRGEAVRPRR